MNRVLRVLPIVMLLAFAGCAEKKPAPVVTTPEPEPVIKPTESVVNPPATKPVSSEQPRVQPEPKVDQVPLVVTAEKGTAEATFQQVLIAFQEGKLDEVFEFLPTSHQADLQNLLHEFAKSMDGEVWSKIFSTMNKCANVMRSKKSQFLNYELLKRLPQHEQIFGSWDGIAGGLADVANSEVASLSDLRQADLKRLLSSASHLLAGMPLPKFGNVDVKTVSADDQVATLSYRESKDGEPKQVDFVKVDGKWLPKSLANSWSDEVEQMKLRLAKLPERVALFKPQIVRHLNSAAELLDKIEASKSQEQFSAAVIELVFSVRLASMMAQDAIQSVSVLPSKEAAIRVEIHRALSDDEQTKLKDSVLAIRNGDPIEYEMVPGDGKTRCRFTPIADPDALVTALQKHFEGADVKLDVDTKTIRVQWK